MCMMESALAELHCNIHRERQISSKSISGFQWGGSSKPYSAILYRPNGAPKFKKIKKIKRERWSIPSAKTEPRSSFLTDKTRMKPCRNDVVFFSLSRSLNQPKKQPKKQVDRRKVGSNDKEEEKGCRGKTEKTGSRVRETGVTSLTLASLPALRRLKHGKQQKKKKNAEERPPPLLTTHTHARSHMHTHFSPISITWLQRLHDSAAVPTSPVEIIWTSRRGTLWDVRTHDWRKL